MLRHLCILGGPQTKEDEIRIGCFTPAFLGAQKRADLLRHPCIHGVPNKGEQNQKWPPHPCLLGPKRGRKCYVTLAFSGVPNKGDKIRSQNPG